MHNDGIVKHGEVLKQQSRHSHRNVLRKIKSQGSDWASRDPQQAGLSCKPTNPGLTAFPWKPDPIHSAAEGPWGPQQGERGCAWCSSIALFGRPFFLKSSLGWAKG